MVTFPFHRLDAIPAPQGETFTRFAAPDYEERHLPGFVINGVTYESHCITIFVARAGELKPGKTSHSSDTGVRLFMRMRHGGGFEFYEITCHLMQSVLPALLSLDDEALYSILYFAWKARREARIAGAEEASHEYRRAFVEGRLKKRKVTGQNKFKVWIEREPVVPA